MRETDTFAPPVTAAQWLTELREHVAREVAPLADEHEHAHRFPHEQLRALAARGIVALGLGLDHPALPDVPADARHALFTEAVDLVASAWLAPAESLHLQVLAAWALAHHGGPAVRERYLDAMVRFEVVGGSCWTEPDVGSDLGAIATRAVDAGDHYVLDGVKSWVGHAPVADVLTVYCRTGGPGLTGISSLLVPVGTPGVVVGPPLGKIAVRSLPNAVVELHDVHVPKTHLLGRPGRGMLVGAEVFRAGRLGLAACANGLAQAALDAAHAHARSRRQFGHAVIEFQGVSFLLADAATRLAASRALVARAAGARGARERDLLGAQAKLFASDGAMTTAVDAVQVLGAAGCGTDRPVERYMREAKVLQIIEGTNQVQRATIASLL